MCCLWVVEGEREAGCAGGQRPTVFKGEARLAGGAMNGPPFTHLRFVRAIRTTVNVNFNVNVNINVDPRKLTRSDPRPPTPSLHVEGHHRLTSPRQGHASRV